MRQPSQRWEGSRHDIPRDDFCRLIGGLLRHLAIFSGEAMTSNLITRLSKLDAPDREVDAEICILFQYGGHNSEGATNVRTDPDWDGDLLFEIGNEDCCNPIPKLTASVDAAIALAERVFPKYGRFVRSDMHGHHAGIFTPYTMTVTEGSGATPAIALLIALLRAKEASK